MEAILRQPESPHRRLTILDHKELMKGTLRTPHTAGCLSVVLTVFRNGEMGDGWRVIETDRGEGETYFGFIYDGRVPTHRQDSVIVRFEAVEDLYGMGRWYTAVLPAGRYEAVSSYRILTGHPAFAGFPGRRTEPRAYISCWRSKWNLQVVERRGWMGTPEDEQKRFGALNLFERITPADRGTDKAVCVE